jgi:hypothetical protein
LIDLIHVEKIPFDLEQALQCKVAIRMLSAVLQAGAEKLPEKR